LNSIQRKLITAFIAAGVAAGPAYVAYDLTLPSEGLVLSPYPDPVGYKTYCVGHLATKTDKVKSSYTEEECLQLFASDWVKHQKELDSVVKVPYASEWERSALTDFTFNNGIGNVQSSTLLKLLNQGKHKQACEQLVKWVFAKGKKLGGLVKRRDKTMPYCLGELPYEKQQDYQEFLKEYERQKANLNR